MYLVDYEYSNIPILENKLIIKILNTSGKIDLFFLRVLKKVNLILLDIFFVLYPVMLSIKYLLPMP